MEKELVRVLFCLMLLLAFVSLTESTTQESIISETNTISTTTTISPFVIDTEEDQEDSAARQSGLDLCNVFGCNCIETREATCNCDITNKVKQKIIVSL